MNINIEGKKILITGGSGTLGSHLVEEALANGAEVLFTYMKNKEKALSLEKKGAHAFTLDLASREAITNLKKEIKERVGHIDVLINNAVAICDKTVANLSEAEWDAVIGASLTGTVFLTKAMIPLLYKSSQGKILTVASQVGLHGGFGQASYAAAKGGLIAFTKSLAKEVGRKKILVNAINPGFMMSEITRHLPQTVLDDNKERSCLASYALPEEVAQFIIYLASDAVSRVSGQVFSFDSRIY